MDDSRSRVLTGGMTRVASLTFRASRDRAGGACTYAVDTKASVFRSVRGASHVGGQDSEDPLRVVNAPAITIERLVLT